MKLVFEARETIKCGDNAISVASERKRGSDRTTWSMPFRFGLFFCVCLAANICVHTHFVYSRKVAQENTFFFFYLARWFLFWFLVFILSESKFFLKRWMHTRVFAENKWDTFLSVGQTQHTHTRSCQYNVSPNSARTFVTEHSWCTKIKIKFVIYWGPNGNVKQNCNIFPDKGSWAEKNQWKTTIE